MNFAAGTNLIIERAKKQLWRDLGDDILGALQDSRTIEIILNADGRLWQEKLGECMRCIGTMAGCSTADGDCSALPFHFPHGYSEAYDPNESGENPCPHGKGWVSVGCQKTSRMFLIQAPGILPWLLRVRKLHQSLECLIVFLEKAASL